MSSSSYGLRSMPGSKSHFTPNNWKNAQSSGPTHMRPMPRQMLLFIPDYPSMEPAGEEYPCFIPYDKNKFSPNMRPMPVSVIDPQMLEQMMNRAYPLQPARPVRSSPTCLGRTKEARGQNESGLVFFPPIANKSQKPASRQLYNFAEFHQHWPQMRRIDIERHNKNIYMTTPILDAKPADNLQFTKLKKEMYHSAQSDITSSASRNQPSARILELAKPRVRKVDEYVKTFIFPQSVQKTPLSPRMEELAKPKEYKSNEVGNQKKSKSTSKSGNGTKKGKKKKDLTPICE